MQGTFELMLEVLLFLAQAAARIFCQQTLNRPFYFFSTFDMGKLGQTVDTSEKSVLKLVKLPSLKVIC